MKNPVVIPALVIASLMFLSACTVTDVATRKSVLGKSATMESLGVAVNKVTNKSLLEFEKHSVANWQVPLSGLLNLKHPRSVNAGIKNRDEPIKLFLYTLTHPNHGTYLIDSGVSETFIDAAHNSDVSFVVKKAMGISSLKVIKTTKQIIKQHGKISGVLLTHLHLDHIMGFSDIASDVPVYIGPRDTKTVALEHLVSRGTTNRLLKTVNTLHEWSFGEGQVLDVFGDGSLWAIHVPGHTPGSTAYLAMTTNGPQLILGDASHTRWGWDNGVEPGTFSHNGPQSGISLAMLKKLVADYPSITAHPGHQH